MENLSLFQPADFESEDRPCCQSAGGEKREKKSVKMCTSMKKRWLILPVRSCMVRPTIPFTTATFGLLPGVELGEPPVCQIVGNLGGWVENAEIDLSTDFVVIADAMVEALKMRPARSAAGYAGEED